MLSFSPNWSQREPYRVCLFLGSFGLDEEKNIILFSPGLLNVHTITFNAKPKGTSHKQPEWASQLWSPVQSLLIQFSFLVFYQSIVPMDICKRVLWELQYSSRHVVKHSFLLII